jgi:hypothetical protein
MMMARLDLLYSYPTWLVISFVDWAVNIPGHNRNRNRTSVLKELMVILYGEVIIKAVGTITYPNISQEGGRCCFFYTGGLPDHLWNGETVRYLTPAGRQGWNRVGAGEGDFQEN